MKALMGAVLAAAMVSGWAGSVQAKTITLDISGAGSVSGGGQSSFTAVVSEDTVDLDKGHVSVSSPDFSLDIDADVQISTFLVDQNAVLNVGLQQVGNALTNGQLYQKLALGSADPVTLSDLSNFDTQVGIFYLSTGPNTAVTYVIDSVTSEIVSPALSFPAVVPLPPTAPLFGAAILALGGATYARRRLSTSAQS